MKSRPWRRFWRRRVLKSALLLSVLLMVAAIALIIASVASLKTGSAHQVISLAVLGAILQAAFLGLVYEVWLRDAVEDSTLEKLGTARDVKEHGLIRLDSEITVDWPTLLDGAQYLAIVAKDPKKLIGHADDIIVRAARDGALLEFRLGIPRGAWQESEAWAEKLRGRWASESSASSFFAVEIDDDFSFDLIATDSRSILVARRVVSLPGIEAGKVLEFRKRSKEGIGDWLDRQGIALKSATPKLGYSPGDEQTFSASDSPVADSGDEETLS